MLIRDVDVLALQTKFMQQDVAVQGFSAALTPQFRRLAEEAGKVAIYSRIDDLPEDVLDVLAWQFSVDWYDPDADVATKRKAIKEALEIHKIKGTPAAVQRVVEIYFGDGDVEEWFQYGGQPGFFRVRTSNPEATNEKAALFAKAVNAVKRLSAYLEAVILVTSDDLSLYFGGVLHMTEKMTVKQVV